MELLGSTAASQLYMQINLLLAARMQMTHVASNSRISCTIRSPASHRNVWACVALMLVSAVCGAATDLSFSAAGYFWQIANCLFTAAYR